MTKLDDAAITLLKALQSRKKGKKFIIYDWSGRHPAYFIETDGRVFRVDGSCKGCKRYCCDIAPASYPEFQGDGKCNHYVYESVDGVEQGRCDIQRNKPLSCAMYPYMAKDKLPEHRRDWDEKNCQYRLVEISK